MAYHISKNEKDNLGFIIEGQTTKDILTALWENIETLGSTYIGAFGKVISVKSATFIINDPFNEQQNYPYWDKKSDDWYQDNFVKKETNLPPEIISENPEFIFPYKYVWRSRYYDSGFGYIKGFLNLLKKQNIEKIDFKTKEAFVDFLKIGSKSFHIQSICNVINWKGIDLINFYLQNPDYFEKEFNTWRRDTLESVINDIKNSKESRRAITPSFTYEQIDHGEFAARGVPVYQNYQLYTTIDQNGKPDGIVSMHLHRAIDVEGGFQLDISHDRAWGEIAQKAIGLPLKKIIIYVNDAWKAIDGNIKNIETKKDIKEWLAIVTDAYKPENFNISKYQKLIDTTWDKINK